MRLHPALIKWQAEQRRIDALMERLETNPRGLRGHYIPNPGTAGSVDPGLNAAAGANTPAFPAPATQLDTALLPVNPQILAQAAAVVQTQNANPAPSVLRPQQTLRHIGRNLSVGEALGHRTWHRNRTLDGRNHLGMPPGTIDHPLIVAKRPWIDLSIGGEGYLEPNIASVMLDVIGTTTVVVSFQVPKRKNGTIEFFANQLLGNWNQGTDDLVWQLRADGLPFKGYDHLIASYGTTALPADLGRSQLRIFENQLIELVVINNNIIPNQQALLGLVRGKFYPIEQEGTGTWV